VAASRPSPTCGLRPALLPPRTAVPHLFAAQ
jgi:hypothetical protein